MRSGDIPTIIDFDTITEAQLDAAIRSGRVALGPAVRGGVRDGLAVTSRSMASRVVDLSGTPAHGTIWTRRGSVRIAGDLVQRALAL